jgi:hypothetical protein
MCRRFGLVEYAFRSDSGYRGEVLFFGRTTSGVVVMRCTRQNSARPSPSCLRELELAPRISLSYRFALPSLSDWRRIADGVHRLVASFRRPPH